MSESVRNIWWMILLSLVWIIILVLILSMVFWGLRNKYVDINNEYKKLDFKNNNKNSKGVVKMNAFNRFMKSREGKFFGKKFFGVIVILLIIWTPFIVGNMESILSTMLGLLVIIRYIIKWPLIILWGFVILYWLVKFIKWAWKD